ncbi:tyrosine-type recombinase/integrase [Streptobacillus moniliformis]|uniref:tyrosine-type recombinase/integrase n=1 Tax=Streptobacillus moniliformis TaxID=34105 RepID=UPI0007E47C22|nr:site-specific integrase [Streptobacillus moniliformis]
MPIYQYTKIVNNKEVKLYKVIYRVDTLEGSKQTTKSGFKTLRSAKEFEASKIAFKEKSTSMLLSDLVTEYLKYCKKRVGTNTYYSYTTLLKKVTEFLKNPQLKSIDILYINSIVDNSKESNNKINNYITVLKRVLRFASNLYGIDIDKKVLDLNRLKKDKQENRQILDLDSYKLLIEFLEEKNSRKPYILPCHLMFYGGLRKGEVHSLMVEDIKDNGVGINKTTTRDNGKFKTKQGGKTEGSTRFVKLPKWLYQELLSYIKLYELKSNDKLFAFNYNTINDIFETFSKETNIKISPHFLRHSHASTLLSEGMPITAVSKRLGHKNIQITMSRYIHIVSKDEEKLDNFILSL